MAKEYEIIPKSEINALKKEIQVLKQEIRANSQAKKIPGEKTLQESIEELTQVFKEAVEELKKQDNQPETNMKVLVEQNEKIARGILALADILNEHLPKIRENTRQQVRARYIRVPVQMIQSQPAPQPMQQPVQQPIQQPMQPTPTQVRQFPQNYPPQPPQPTQNIPQPQGKTLKGKPLPRHEIKF